MAKSGFQFKQFYIEHSRCAMKVGTDSILLGSWADAAAVSSVLDIGTGSGLLAIMLAQKTNEASRIQAIDIDEGAIEQAKSNTEACPWPDKLCVEKAPLQQFSHSTGFDLIISNPPYYPPGQTLTLNRQQARHTSELSHRDLLQHAKRLLAPGGRLALVLPSQFCEALLQTAQEMGWFVRRKLEVKTTPNKVVSRLLLEFVLRPEECEVQELVIQQHNGKYTEHYRQLTRDFYLNF